MDTLCNPCAEVLVEENSSAANMAVAPAVVSKNGAKAASRAARKTKDHLGWGAQYHHFC